MGINYHEREAKRIQNELDELSPEFANLGIVRAILRRRITQEQFRAGQSNCKRMNNGNKFRHWMDK